MGDFVYARNVLPDGRIVGAHSIDFILEDGTKLNTWTNYYLAPMARPFVAAPQVKTEFINVPGADGALDYTDALTGRPRFANRSGQWQFIMENGHFSWPTVMSQMLNKLHGKKVKVVLTDDPDYYYKGRISLNVGFGNKDYSSVVIAYNFDPYKYPIDSTDIADWKWKELFGNTIEYGTFSINGIKTRTLLNSTGSEVTCTINVTNTVTMFRVEDGELYHMIQDDFDITKYEPTYLRTGDNEVTLAEGANMVVFKGSAIAKVNYERGKTL